MNHKRKIAWLLLLAMLLTLAPVNAYAAPEMAAAEELVANPETDFRFDPETGTITRYTGAGGTLVIPETIDGVAVEHIRQGVFGGKNLEKVVFPSGLKTIGQLAFFQNAIAELVFPEGLTDIGPRAFSNNKVLTSVEFPDSLERIGFRAFEAVESLTTATIPDGVQDVGRGAFLNATALTELPVTAGEGAAPVIFHDVVLEGTFDTWHVPLGRSILAMYTILGAENTEPKYIVGGTVEVAAGSTPQEIQAAINGAFPLESGFAAVNKSDASGMTDLFVRTPVDWIIPEDIDTSAGSEVELTGAFREIPESAFEVDTTVYSVVEKAVVDARLPLLVPKVGVRFVQDESSVWTAADFTYGRVEDKRVAAREYFAVTGLTDAGKEKLDSRLALVLPNTGTEIVDGETVEKPIQGIGRNAFSNLGLTEVTLPDIQGQTEFVIGAGAFSHNALKAIDLPVGVKIIDTEAFFSNQIEAVSIPSSMLIIGNSAFQKNEIKTLEISDDVRNIQIDNFSFAHNKLTEVDLPYSLFKIREYVFANNTGMEPITAADALPDDVNYGVVHLHTRNPLHLHTSTYIYNSRYQKLILPEEAVDRQDLFEQINIAQKMAEDEYTPESYLAMQTVLAAAKEAFEDPAASQATIDQREEALKKAIAALAPVDVNKKALAATIAEAEQKNPKLFTEDSMAALADAIAEANSALSDTSLTQEQVDQAQQKLQAAIDALQISDAAKWTSSDFTYDGTTITGYSPTGREKFRINKDLVLPNNNPSGEAITAIGPDAFAIKDSDVLYGTDSVTSPDGLTSVVLPKSLERIEARAFRLNAISGVNMPRTLQYIGPSAFNGNQIQSLRIPDSVTEMGEGVFSLNQLESLTISKGLTEIPGGAFSRNTKLASVVIPRGVKTIGSSAFQGAPLKSLSLSSKVENIERRAFSTHRIEHLTIPGTVKNIGPNAFEHNVKFRYMTKLTLGEGIETIGSNAFKSGLLSETTLPKSLKTLAPNAFADNLDANKEQHTVKLYTYNPDHEAFESNKNQEIILRDEPIVVPPVDDPSDDTEQPPVVQEPEKPVVEPVRVAGDNRIDTANAISKRYFTSADQVILVSARVEADALVSSSLAKQLNSPILLTETGEVDEATLAEIARLGAKKVVIVGGENVVSDAVIEQLNAKGLDVERVSGENRFATAARLADMILDQTGGTEIYLVDGTNFPDALAASNLSTTSKNPILLTRPNALPEETAQWIKDRGITHVTIIGGVNSVSEEVAESLGVTTKRIAGDNRYETSLLLAKEGYPNAKTVVLASGTIAIDSLTAGAILPKVDAPLILVNPSGLSSDLADYLQELQVENVIVIGGERTLPASIITEIKTLLK